MFLIILDFTFLVQGQKLMMMGTADEIVKAPEKGPVFAEDMPEEELVVSVVSLVIVTQQKKSRLLYCQFSSAFMMEYLIAKEVFLIIFRLFLCFTMIDGKIRIWKDGRENTIDPLTTT